MQITDNTHANYWQQSCKLLTTIMQITDNTHANYWQHPCKLLTTFITNTLTANSHNLMMHVITVYVIQILNTLKLR